LDCCCWNRAIGKERHFGIGANIILTGRQIGGRRSFDGDVARCGLAACGGVGKSKTHHASGNTFKLS